MGLELGVWFSHYQSSDQKQEISAAFNNLFNATPLRYAANQCAVARPGIDIPLRFTKSFVDKLLLRPRILVKDPIALLSAEWLYKTYDLDVIVLIRNPISFVGSMKAAGWDFPVENLFKQKSLMTEWLNQFAALIESMINDPDNYDINDRLALLWNALHVVILRYQNQYPKWLFIKYEDIAMNPVIGFSRIFDYLRLGLNRDILDYIKCYTSAENSTEPFSTAYRPRDPASCLHNWRERLSDHEVERVKIATSGVARVVYPEMFQSLTGEDALVLRDPKRFRDDK